MSQYVGKTISLVNKANLRYVGTSSKVSAETSSLVLQNVYNYGTEDRVSGAGSIPGEAEEISEMTFLGGDVSDLQVLDSESAQPEGADSQENSTKEVSEFDADDEFFYAQTSKFSQEDAEEDVQADPVYNKSSSFFDNFTAPSRTDRSANVKHDAMNRATFGEDARDSSSDYRGHQRTRGSGPSREGRGGRGGRGRRGSRGNDPHGSRRLNSEDSLSEPTYYFDKRDKVFRDKSTGDVFDPTALSGRRLSSNEEIDDDGFITTRRSTHHDSHRGRSGPSQNLRGSRNRGGRGGRSGRDSQSNRFDHTEFDPTSGQFS